MSCTNGNTEPQSEVNDPSEEQVIPVKEQAQNTNYECQYCKGTGICSACNGSGYLEANGESFICPSCKGSGQCAFCNIITNDTHSGRASYDIERDIQRVEHEISDIESTLQRLKENNESVTLWPSYENMLAQYNERLENLKEELRNSQ